MKSIINFISNVYRFSEIYFLSVIEHKIIIIVVIITRNCYRNELYKSFRKIAVRFSEIMKSNVFEIVSENFFCNPRVKLIDSLRAFNICEIR